MIEEATNPKIFLPNDPSYVLDIDGRDIKGNKIYDRSEKGNHGTIMGAKVKPMNYGLPSLSFDGTCCVNCGEAVNEEYDAMTISAWIKPSSFDPTRWRTPLHRSNSTSVGSSVFFIGLSSGNNEIIATIGSESMGSIYAAGATGIMAQIGKWYYIVNSWDGVNARVYVNNVREGGYVLSSATFYNKSADTRIGSSGDSTGYLFNGLVNNVKIYGRALSVSEISKQFNQLRNIYGM